MGDAACMVCDGKGSRYVEGTGPKRCGWCAGTGVRLVDPQAKVRECVYCGADIDEPCKTARGTVMQTTHFARDPR